MKRALLVLTAQERAIFTARAATEGAHETRSHPTGAALLGWAANRIYADLDSKRAYHVFHSGLVRFSDALPLAHDGQVAFPSPKILVSAKSGKSPFDGDGELSKDAVWVGWTAFKAQHPDRQAEAVKDHFLTDRLQVVRPSLGGRLRTATLGGRAKEAALFGYAHLEPFADGGDEDRPARYAATIEGDLSDTEWDRLRAAFADAREPLRLGRAAGTSYGGWYACEWREDAEYLGYFDNRPVRGELTASGARLRVWLLSDLAVLDAAGATCLDPPPELLGLPRGGTLVRHESATGTRRYAPWNAWLRRRDIERQVIAAGSVLTYDYADGVPANFAMPTVAGLFREQGLGALWIDPPVLRERHPAASTGDESVPRAAGRGASTDRRTEAAPPPGIAAWASRMASLSDPAARDLLREDWIATLDRLLRQAGTAGPSANQWREVANAARGAPDHASLLAALFAPPSAVCGTETASTRGGDWLAPLRFTPSEPGAKATVRQWLKERLDDARPTRLGHVKWALDALAKHRAEKLRQRAET